MTGVQTCALPICAGFVVAVCGSMTTMPGLPKRPAAFDMDMDEDGNLTGIFS